MSYEERPGIAERVLAVRKRRGITQKEAAAEIGINEKYLADIEEYWIPHEGIWEKVREWLKRWAEAIAATDAAAADAAAADAAAAEEETEQEEPPPPDRPPRVPAQLLLAIRRLTGRK